MKTKTKNLTALLALAASTLLGTAQGASLSLVPSAATVAQNTVFTVDLVLDAQDAPGSHPGLYGGEIVINFNPGLLSYGGFATAGAVELFAGPTTGSGTVSFGFEKASDLGTVGTFTFTAIGSVGSLATIGLADADDFFGTFIAYAPTDTAFYPAFNGTSVGITAVPLPAGLWLLATGLGALGVRARWRGRA